MAFSIFGFLLGRVFAERQGVADETSLNRVALVGGVVGTSPVGLIVTTAVAQREAELGPPVSPAPTDLVDVPDVTDQTIDQAQATMQAVGLQVQQTDVVSTADKGTLIAQDPAPHSMVPTGSTVTLFVSKGKQAPGQTLVPVPDVAGQPFADARETLQDEDFKLTKKPEASSADKKDIVIRTEPPGGTLVEPESRVTVVVGSGQPSPGKGGM